MDRLETLLEFLHEDPDDPFTRFAIAQEYLKNGDFEQSVSFFEDLIRDHPDYVGTYYHLGKLYERTDRLENAQMTYRTGIEIATSKNDAHARAELQSALLESEEHGFDD
ncbi:MAG: tetratricopeptide repeat protein [Rubricoccaceae bacterium]|nr:tetratricopeptide repeat protein [Rubricoccaceae bacterium]